LGRKPRREIIGDAGKEPRFGDPQRKPREIVGFDSDDECRQRRHDPPGDHDPRDPAPRAETVEREVAGDLEDGIADEQDAGADAELRRGEAEILVHRQRRETDIGAVEIVDDISQGEERDDPPGNLLEYRFLLRIHLVASPGGDPNRCFHLPGQVASRLQQMSGPIGPYIRQQDVGIRPLRRAVVSCRRDLIPEPAWTQAHAPIRPPPRAARHPSGDVAKIAGRRWPQ